MKVTKTIAALTALLLSLSTGAFASEKDHDAAPKYGGVVSVVKDVNYELVAKPDIITLYIIDHGKPVDTKNASATLTLLSASDKSEVKMTPAGENKLEAKGNFKVDKGTKVVASVTTGGKPQSVRFTLK
ncbi:hypothetical protein [Noviherbaspirillum sp.]|uniref:hypothetical protein n=1 Tax=Noviherbaspirillum sp. TaxID=1926288 RepID=UPI002FE0B148